MSGPVRADIIEPEDVEFIWEGRIPRGMISVIAGRPEQGKGLLAAHIAADCSRRGLRVLYSAAEDSYGAMTGPRLMAADANLKNILLWRFRLPEMRYELDHYVREHKIDLIVMDPMAAHLSGGVSRHSDSIRVVTEPLTDLIEDTGAAVVIVEHALKGTPGYALGAIGGSGSGLPAATRVAYLLGIDPDDMDRRVLVPVKFNIGERPKSLCLEMDVTRLPGMKRDTAFLIKDQEIEFFNPMKLFEVPVNPVGRPNNKLNDACEWLLNFLIGQGEPVLSSAVKKEAASVGMSSRTLDRAVVETGVQRSAKGGPSQTYDLPQRIKDELEEDLRKLIDGTLGDEPS